MKFNGVMRQPSQPRVLEVAGDKYLNSWNLPDWGRGVYDIARVDPFIDFIEYLCPEGNDD